MSDRPELLTTKDVAAWLKIKPSQVERYGIPRYVVTRKMVRFLASDVRAWLEGFKRNGGTVA